MGWEIVLLVLHLIVSAALIFLVLMQRSEGGALGIGGGTGGLMSARGAADMMVRLTSGAGAAFFATSLILSVIAGHRMSRPDELIIGSAPVSAPTIPGPGELTPTPVSVRAAPVDPTTVVPPQQPEAAQPVAAQPRPTPAPPATRPPAPAAATPAATPSPAPAAQPPAATPAPATESPDPAPPAQPQRQRAGPDE